MFKFKLVFVSVHYATNAHEHKCGSSNPKNIVKNFKTCHHGKLATMFMNKKIGQVTHNIKYKRIYIMISNVHLTGVKTITIISKI